MSIRTYAATAHPVTLGYLKKLGITAVELLPVHHFVADRHLVEKGLTNYWRYNSIGFFAADAGYSASGVSGEQVTEFKSMVRALQKTGIEVILDVVYNYTAEGNTQRGNNNAYCQDNEISWIDWSFVLLLNPKA